MSSARRLRSQPSPNKSVVPDRLILRADEPSCDENLTNHKALLAPMLGCAGAGLEAVVEVEMISEKKSGTSFASALRRELADRAQKYAQTEGLPYCLSYGETPIVCFAPRADSGRFSPFLACL
jgi:hypothetical protein